MNERKCLKYGILRRFPGFLGRHYGRKYSILESRKTGFADALLRTAGTTCIDLGANVGAVTRKMAAGASRVIAFEPDPWAYEMLRAAVAALDNVQLENAAAGMSDGTVLLYRRAGFDSNPARYSQSSSILACKRSVSEKGAVRVRQIDFIRYLEELDENIGILKMDIEGAEVELLEALLEKPDLLQRIAYIFAETHERGIPGHKPRVAALRGMAERIASPRIDLDWQ